MKKIIIMILFVLLVCVLVWFFKQQNTVEGYVLISGKGGIRIIETYDSPTPPKVKGKTPEEIDKLYRFQGLDIDMPIANKIIFSSFMPEEKVRVYYTGGVYLTAPGRLIHPHFIIKLKK